MLSCVRDRILWVALLGLTAAGCNQPDPASGAFVAEQVISASFPTPAHSGAIAVTVVTFNGDIDVVTDAIVAPEAEITARGVGADREAAIADAQQNISSKLAVLPNGYSISVQRTEPMPDQSRAAVHLRAPPGTALDLKTNLGNITVSGPMGDVKAATDKGDVSVRGSAGKLILATGRGSIEVDGGQRQLNLSAAEGNIGIVSSNVTVTARTTNGQIRYSGSLAAGTSTFGTTHQGITILLPLYTLFNVDATTSDNAITSEYPLTRSTGLSRTIVCAAIDGNPSVSLDLVPTQATSGHIIVNALDGRNHTYGTIRFVGALDGTYYDFHSNAGSLVAAVPDQSTFHIVTGLDGGKIVSVTTPIISTGGPSGLQLCDRQARSSQPKPATTLILRTTGGPIEIRQITPYALP